MEKDYKIGHGKIELRQGSITRYPADALVCPANPDLEMVVFPGGVQYVFFVEGGPQIFQEAVKIGKISRINSMDTNIPMSVPITSAHLTSAGNLPARHVIHSVAVGYDTKKGLYCNKEIIGKSTNNVLELAKEKGLKSVGFPALGTGLYNVPLEDAVEAMGKIFSSHLKRNNSFDRIGLVLYSPDQFLKAKKKLDTICL